MVYFFSKYRVRPESNWDASFKSSFCCYMIRNVSWLHWTLAPPEITASLSCSLFCSGLFYFIFLCIYHFSSLSEVLGFLPFHCVGIEFWETYFVFPLGFVTLPFGFPDNFRFALLSLLSENVDIAFGSQWLAVAQGLSIPQGLCITFRSLFSAPCFQIKSSFLS